MSKLRAGVIGLGIGVSHIRGYREHPDVEVVAIADIDPVRLAEVGTEYGISSRYENALEMLEREKLDVVSVATPNNLHKPLAIAALEAGAHVLCEKPMATNAVEARAMLACSKRTGQRLMINFSFRFNEQAYAMKRLVDAGTLGEVYFGRSVWHRRRGVPGFGGWFGQKSLSGGGPLIDLGVHRLDLALWLMGFPSPTWVLGSTYAPIASAQARDEGKAFDVEDLAVALIRFSNGATLEIEASWAANIREREFMETRLLGTRAGLVQRNKDEGYEFEAEVYLEREGCQFDMSLHPPVPAARRAPYHFIDAIVHNTPHLATGEQGVMVMEILDAVYRSAEIGAPVDMAVRASGPPGSGERALRVGGRARSHAR